MAEPASTVVSVPLSSWGAMRTRTSAVDIIPVEHEPYDAGRENDGGVEDGNELRPPPDSDRPGPPPPDKREHQDHAEDHQENEDAHCPQSYTHDAPLRLWSAVLN